MAFHNREALLIKKNCITELLSEKHHTFRLHHLSLEIIKVVMLLNFFLMLCVCVFFIELMGLNLQMSTSSLSHISLMSSVVRKGKIWNENSLEHTLGVEALCEWNVKNLLHTSFLSWRESWISNKCERKLLTKISFDWRIFFFSLT